MNNLPDFIILDISDIIQDCEEQLSQSWIFTVDIEFVLQNLFNCFIDVQNTDNSLSQFYNWLRVEGLEVKSENTTLQIDFVIHVIKETANSILNKLIEYGYYDYEFFPYRFKSKLSDSNITLVRCDYT